MITEVITQVTDLQDDKEKNKFIDAWVCLIGYNHSKYLVYEWYIDLCPYPVVTQ